MREYYRKNEETGIRMKKRTLIRLFSFAAALLLATLGFALKSAQKAARYRLQIETGYSHMLDCLNESTGNISVLLQKAAYATSPAQRGSIAADLLAEAQSAKIALSQLPSGDGELSTLNRFLSQVGNYAVTVSQNTGGQENYAANIAALQQTAKKISDAVGDSAITYNNPAEWEREIDRKIGEALKGDSFAGAAAKLEESLTDYPTLVYDGPYSDHILEKEPQMIKNKPVVSRDEAKTAAAEAANCREKDLRYDGDVNGSIPAYRFVGDGLTVTVSKQGGYTVFLRRSRTVQTHEMSEKQLSGKAKAYLKNLGMDGFEETYFFTDEGVCVFNFAFRQGDTLCYTDLVKVGVATDNGEVMLLETSGYLTNHTARVFAPPAVSEKEAAKAVHPGLTVTSVSLALIPTDGGNEKRCYEFLCRTEDGREMLVYIDVASGAEQDLLLLLKSDGGTLTK